MINIQDLYKSRRMELRSYIMELAGLVAQSRKAPFDANFDVGSRIAEHFGILYQGPTDCYSNHILGLFKDMEVHTIAYAISDHFLTAFDKSCKMSLAYLEIADIYELRATGKNQEKVEWNDLLRLILKLFAYALVDRMEKYLKYDTCSLLARALENELPETPKGIPWDHVPGRLFTGSLGRKIWMRCAVRKRKQDISLAYSIYQAKRVAPAVSDRFIEEKINDNTTALSREEPISSLPSHIYDQRIDELERQVRRTVREVFHLAREKGWHPSHGGRIPTLSSCLEKSQSSGGSFEQILGNNPYCLISEPYLVGYACYSTRQVPIYVPCDPEEVRSRLQPSRAGDPRVHIRQVGLPEPFKVRVITVGQAQGYQIARNHQRSMWSMMQASSVFELTGKPIDSDAVKGSYSFVPETKVHSILVSGDYTAATDNFDPRLSDAALHEYCRLARVSAEDQLWLHGCLTRQILDVKTDQGETEEIQQTWGQTMGSPISFPFLCLVNSAVTRYVQERAYERKLSYAEGNFQRVNGDDILFPLPPREYSYWKETVEVAGLLPSPGKNYVSREYAVLNSDVFRLPTDWDRNTLSDPEPIPCVKLNLMMGQDESCERRGGIRLFHGAALQHGKTLRGRMQELIKHFDAETADNLITRCIRYHRPILDKLPKVSWWVSVDKGGLGFPLVYPERAENISPLHRRIAAFLGCLTMESYREQVRMTWLREPGPYYSSLSLEKELELAESLNVPLLQRANCKEGFHLVQDENRKMKAMLLRGYALCGSDREEREDKTLLKTWERSLYRWIRLANKTKGNIKLMTPFNATVPNDHKVCFDVMSIV